MKCLSSFQFSRSVTSTFCNPMDRSMPGLPVHYHQLPPSVYPNSCPLSWWCHTTISSSVVPVSSCLQSFLAIRVFWNGSALHIRWPKYWSFNFNISPSNEHSRLISFRMDWWDLLAVQGTLKNLLQHHSSKASILRCSPFFIIQLTHPYLTTGETIASTRQTVVDKHYKW